ncbi:MAG TPA: YdeI/OmpD-associated family protein [Methylomirabilota bacterium]|nr:YdeI/OmpD-associated family protein [Methylomirabilota bacterium]
MKESLHGKSRSTPRKIQLPADLEDALRRNVRAQAIFQGLPPSHQREYVEWIDEAKKEDTRRNRIQKALSMLLENG